MIHMNLYASRLFEMFLHDCRWIMPKGEGHRMPRSFRNGGAGGGIARACRRYRGHKSPSQGGPGHPPRWFHPILNYQQKKAHGMPTGEAPSQPIPRVRGRSPRLDSIHINFPTEWSTWHGIPNKSKPGACQREGPSHSIPKVRGRSPRLVWIYINCPPKSCTCHPYSSWIYMILNDSGCF